VVRAQNGETEEDDEYSDESELTVYKQQRDALYRKALEAGSKKIGKNTGTGGAVCKGATPSVEQPGGRGFKPRLRSLLD
jgi:hypothetical protein